MQPICSKHSIFIEDTDFIRNGIVPQNNNNNDKNKTSYAYISKWKILAYLPLILIPLVPYLHLNKDGWILIFYTRNEALGFDLIQNCTQNLKIIQEQPELRRLVLNLIYDTESGRGILEEKLNVDESEHDETPIVKMKTSEVENDEVIDLESVSLHSSNLDDKREAEEIMSIDDTHYSSSINDDISYHSERSLTLSTNSQRPSAKDDFDPYKDYGEVAEAFAKDLAVNRKNILQTLGFQNRNDVLRCCELVFCGDSSANEDILRDISPRYNADLNTKNYK